MTRDRTPCADCGRSWNNWVHRSPLTGQHLFRPIRGEHAGALDVERFETAWRNVEVEDDRVGIIGRGRFIDRIAAEYARLAEDADDPRP